MFSRGLLALCGAAYVIAQTTYSSPFLAEFLILSDFSVSTVDGDATHTTYNVRCDSDVTLCSLPPTGVTVFSGPSSVGLSFSEPMETLTSSVGCTYIDSRASAVCVNLLAAPAETVESGSLVTSMATFRSTTTLPAASVALGFNAPVATADATSTGKMKPTTESTSTGKVAEKTTTAASETQSGGAIDAFGRGNAGLVAGAAILGLGLI
ncbi:uncharacterized protein N7443_000922 [Penicillium atrosanguineum]|uniref:Uncharacterized protein n=1 Tax=Penicillium atrosanguineum TaxID=1132637 RepID=A0A9W9UD86_9EURO|nr:uncharacterized protein N7443_000922 [Penicillium atrosanguineum]KAJ5147486.1 hypothetical protein N7526_000838 [Penicillium atrosanguineum]KAJ5314038.1 hypothetical protein N7443_000922 [Penicillium atrosanguineum]KAJ5331204.1 hypothetical protein N7476_000987 [Penicillium atrosanguineum]